MHKFNSKLLIALLCFLIVFSFFYQAKVAKAFYSAKYLLQDSESSPTCYPLDVIFIIDQSDSMSGIYSGQPNDPIENRTYAPQWTVDWLADNALDQCEDSIHRITVISFGNDCCVAESLISSTAYRVKFSRQKVAIERKRTGYFIQNLLVSLFH